MYSVSDIGVLPQNTFYIRTGVTMSLVWLTKGFPYVCVCMKLSQTHQNG